MNHTIKSRRVSPAAWLLIWPIRLYQVAISRFTPATCRYYPCCSSYAITALRRHGALKGLGLAIWRLARCNPWSSGGVDKVPPRGRWRREVSEPAGGVIHMYDATARAKDVATADRAGAWTAGRTAA